MLLFMIRMMNVNIIIIVEILKKNLNLRRKILNLRIRHHEKKKTINLH